MKNIEPERLIAEAKRRMPGGMADAPDDPVEMRHFELARALADALERTTEAHARLAAEAVQLRAENNHMLARVEAAETALDDRKIERAVESILADLGDRPPLRPWLDTLDDEDRGHIKTAWFNIIVGKIR